MRSTRPGWLVLGLLWCLALGLALACGRGATSGGAADDAATPLSGEAVPLGGGVRGTLAGPASERGVVIISDRDGAAAWSEVAGELTRSGYRVLLYPRPAQGSTEVARSAAAALLARGAEKVVLVASREGGADALAAPGDAVGLVLVNPTARPDPVPAAGMPPTALLVIAALNDAEGTAVARRLYAAAVEPRELALVPGAAGNVPALIAAPASGVSGATPGAGGGLRGIFLDFVREAFMPQTA